MGDILLCSDCAERIGPGCAALRRTALGARYRKVAHRRRCGTMMTVPGLIRPGWAPFRNQGERRIGISVRAQIHLVRARREAAREVCMLRALPTSPRREFRR